MKSLLLAPLLAFVSNDATDKNDAQKPVAELALVAKVEFDRPLVQIEPPARVVPIIAEREDRLDALRENIDHLAASLKVTKGAMENVAEQRDEARREVRALAMANHEVLKQMNDLRAELEGARKEGAKWKEQASMMEAKFQERAMAQTDLMNFRREMQETMKEVQTMKGDLALARGELQDPIERSALKSELAGAKQEVARLGSEIELALQERTKSMQEAAQTREQMEAQIAELRRDAEDGRRIRDDLRNVNAVKMKALADVEVLKKQVEAAHGEQVTMSAELEVVRADLVALQTGAEAMAKTEKTALHERDEAQAALSDMRGELMSLKMELEEVRNIAAAAGEKMKAAEAGREAVRQEMVVALQVQEEERKKMKESLALAKEGAVGLTEAKAGLEELLFRKNAELRKLKGEMRKIAAATKKDEPAEPASAEPAPDEESEDEGPDRSQALAD